MNESFDQFLDLAHNFGPRFIASVIAGGIIGVERQIFAKPAGLRTCLLVSMATCIITIVSIAGALKFGGDPMRITAQIVTGIGFIGGGVILKYEDRIRGITTAATIFVCAATGITAGTGYIFTAVAVSIMVFVVLLALRPVDRYIDQMQWARKLRAEELAVEEETYREQTFLNHMVSQGKVESSVIKRDSEE